MRMNDAETSASIATAAWTPLTVVSRSWTTAEIDTFMNDVSMTNTNMAAASRMASRGVPPASSGMWRRLRLVRDGEDGGLVRECLRRAPVTDHDRVQVGAGERARPEPLDPGPTEERGAWVRDREDRRALAHPEVVDLVVDPHALALVAQGAAALEQLEDVVVAVERPLPEREQPAEEAVRIRVVGRPPRPPEGRVAESLAVDVRLVGLDLDPRPDRLPQLDERLERLQPVGDDHLQHGQPLAVRVAGLVEEGARLLEVVLEPDPVRVRG